MRQFSQLAGSDEDRADDIAERYPVDTVKVAYLPGAQAAFFLFGLAVLVFPVRKKWL